MLIVTYIWHRSPLVRTYVDRHGINLLRPGYGDLENIINDGSTLKSLPSDMAPPQNRSFLTTSSAIRATALRCLACYATRFHAMQPYTTWISFEQHDDESNSMPAMSRYAVPDTGPVRWTGLQRVLKGFWMVYTARLFLEAFEQGDFHDWSKWKIAEMLELKSIDVFNFPRHGDEYGRKRPRDYLLTALHLYLGAEEYLQDIEAPSQKPPTLPLPNSRVKAQAKPGQKFQRRWSTSQECSRRSAQSAMATASIHGDASASPSGIRRGWSMQA